jgi:indole-3-glycerol phosphate synthase
MITILDKIIIEKKKEVTRFHESFRTLKHTVRPKISLIERVENASTLAVIAEFKRASPSKGIINNQRDPVLQAIQYEQNGATAVSVLTDSTFFKGSFEDLLKVRESLEIPILCKDFIIDRVQIDVAKQYGADVILLIASALSRSELLDLYLYASHQELEVLIEVHDEEDLEKALFVQPRLIGVNNRNLRTFEVNLNVTEKLAPVIRSHGAIVISESGIFNREDAQRVRDAGASGVLVGESLMRSQNLTNSISDLKIDIQKG